MGRINNKTLYGIDNQLSLDDFLIGSDAETITAGGEKTKNYLLRGIYNTFRSALNLASIEYKFSDRTEPTLDENDPGYFTTNGNNTSAPAVNTIYLNKIDLNSIDITSMLSAVSENPTSFTIRLFKASAPGQVFYFAVGAVVDSGDYFTISVSNFVGGLTLVDDTTYSLVFDLSGTPSIYSETDPIFTASAAAGITAGQITNWDTAFGWGDHSVEGYLKATDSTTITGTWSFDSVDDIQFNSTSPAHSPGLIFWDGTNSALSYYNDEPDVTLQIGQENYIAVRNNTGVTIPNGTAVYVTGAVGFRTTVAPAQANGTAASRCIGIATHDIGNNENGYVTTLGTVNNLNTSGFTAGDQLYLSPSVAGGITNVRPTGTDEIVDLGVCLVSNPTNGSIKVIQRADSESAVKDVAQTITGAWTFSNPITVEGDTVTAVKIGTWDLAYTWGDHSVAGYISAETDPVFSASPAAGIIAGDINNWDSAYSWGNHNTVNPPFKETVSTGIISGGVISINGLDNTKFDIAAGKGYIVDHTVDPPTITTVEFGPFTSQTVTNLATKFSTDIAIDENGFIIQQDSFTDAERRQYIMLGGLDHSNKTNILRAFQIQSPLAAPASSLQELSRALGDINIDGNVYAANGVNLNLNKTGGTVFSFGRGNTTSELEPHKVVTGSGTAISFAYVFDNGAGVGSFTALTTSIDPNNYDNGSGTLAAVPANRFTIQRFLYFPNGDTTFVQYGTTTYVRKQDAEAAVATVSFPALNGIKTALVRGYLLVQQGETDLTSANTEFYASNKFGSVIAGSSVTTFAGLTDTNFTALAKGDIAVFDGTEWVDLTVGANGTLLVADSAEATGVKWASGYVKADGTVPMTGTLTTRSLLPGDAADTIGDASNRYDNAYFDELTIGTGTAVDAILSFNADVTGNLAMQATTGILFWSGNTVWHDGNYPLNITAAAKGDILVFNGTDWVDLTVGSNTQLLSANSATATGLEWVAAPTGATWGAITGTLSSQTDLQTALDGKLSDTGDTITGNLTYNNASNSGILRGADSQRMLIGGGTAWSGVNGAYIEIQGIDYGGVGLGGDIKFQMPSGTEFYVSQTQRIGGNSLQIEGASPRIQLTETAVDDWFLLADAGQLTVRQTTTATIHTRWDTNGDILHDKNLSVEGGTLNIGEASVQNGTVNFYKSDGGSVSIEWEDDYMRYRRSGSGTMAGWRWDNFDSSSPMTLTTGGDLDIYDGLTVGGLAVIGDDGLNAAPLRVNGTGDWSVSTATSQCYIVGRDSTADSYWYLGNASAAHGDIILYSYPAAQFIAIKESGALEFSGSLVDFDSAAVDVNDIRIDDIAIWYVSSSDSAHQRADARDDATNYARLHWYGVTDTGSTSNFRHAWYDGTNYVDIDYLSDNLTWYAGANSLTFTIASQGDANLVVEADRDNVTETDNPTIQMWQDNAAVKAIWGIEGTGGVAFSGAAANSPYFDTLGASSWNWAINGTKEMSLSATELDLGSNHLIVDGFTLENSTDRAGLLQITDSVTTRAYYGFQIKDDSGQLFSMMSNATVWGVYDDTNSKWGIQFNANSSVRLYFNASIKLETSNVGITVTGDGTATDWNATSDIRLKDNIRDFEPRGRVNWKQYERDGVTEFGAVAQDVETYAPEVVKTIDHKDLEGCKTVSYRQLQILENMQLRKELDEARAERDELKDRVAKLEDMFNSLAPSLN